MSDKRSRIAEICDEVIGEDKDAAQAIVAANNFRFRITSEDGVGNRLTRDYRKDRINVAVVSGKVTKATIG